MTASRATDAAFLAKICERTIRWAKIAAHYQSDAQRREVIELYERALSVYLEQASTGQ